jgi:hypothetical protein
MIQRLILALCLFQLAAAPVFAGPWLREKGSSFTSFSFSASMNLDAHSTGFFEFGITPTSTVGLDVGFSRYNSGDKLGYGTLFLRRALGPTDRPNKFAYEVGIGGTYGGTNRDLIPHFKTGLTWGRGIEFKGKGGWLTMDTGVLWNLHNYDHVIKVDTTLGLRFTDFTTGILQLNLANQTDETFGFFEPSLVFSPRNMDLKVQIGLITPLESGGKTSLKLGLWREF